MEPALPPEVESDVAQSLEIIATSLLRLATAQERAAAAQERAALALQRQALTVPNLADDEARWLFSFRGHTLPAFIPKEPEQVKDPRTRTVMLARTWAERLCDWAMPKERREAKWAAEKAAREAAALAEAGASFANNGHQPAQVDDTPF